MFNVDGRMIRLKPNDDKFAGVNFEELKQRKDDVNCDTEARAKILRKTLLGPTGRKTLPTESQRSVRRNLSRSG